MSEREAGAIPVEILSEKRYAGARSVLGWWLLAFILHVPLLYFIRLPGYLDANYYLHVATNLSRGEGLVEHFTWSYLVPFQSLTHPANLYWQPAWSVLLAGVFLFTGPSFLVAQLLSIACFSTMAVIGARFARRWFGPTAERLAFFYLVFSGLTYPYAANSDALALFGFLGAVLWEVLDRREFRGWRGIVVGPLLALLALTRLDGLLALPVVLFDCWRCRRVDGRFILGVVLGLAMIGGWWLRNDLVVGAWPVPGGGRSLFIRDYREFFWLGDTGRFTLRGFLSWGIGPILVSRLQGLLTVTVSPYGVFGALGYLLVVPTLVGFWQRRTNSTLFSPVAFGTVLFVTSGLLYPEVSAHGSFLHAFTALLPIAGALAAGGTVALARGLESRHVSEDRAFSTGQLLMGSLVVGMIAMSLAFTLDAGQQLGADWPMYQQVASRIGDRTPLISDPSGYTLATGHSAAMLPYDPNRCAALTAARWYHASVLILQPNHPTIFQSLWDGKPDARFSYEFSMGDLRVYRINPRVEASCSA